MHREIHEAKAKQQYVKDAQHILQKIDSQDYHILLNFSLSDLAKVAELKNLIAIEENLAVKIQLFNDYVKIYTILKVAYEAARRTKDIFDSLYYQALSKEENLGTVHTNIYQLHSNTKIHDIAIFADTVQLHLDFIANPSNLINDVDSLFKSIEDFRKKEFYVHFNEIEKLDKFVNDFLLKINDLLQVMPYLFCENSIKQLRFSAQMISSLIDNLSELTLFCDKNIILPASSAIWDVKLALEKNILLNKKIVNPLCRPEILFTCFSYLPKNVINEASKVNKNWRKVGQVSGIESTHKLMSLMEKFPNEADDILQNVINNPFIFNCVFEDGDDVLRFRFYKGDNQAAIIKVLNGCSPIKLEEFILKDQMERNLDWYCPEQMAVLRILNPVIEKGQRFLLALKDFNFLKDKDLKSFIICLDHKLHSPHSYYNENKLYLALKGLKIFIENSLHAPPSLSTLCIKAIQTNGLFSAGNSNPSFNPLKLTDDIKEKFYIPPKV